MMVSEHNVEQNNGVRAEYAICVSTAGRQNKPFYEQNSSTPGYQYRGLSCLHSFMGGVGS